MNDIQKLTKRINSVIKQAVADNSIVGTVVIVSKAGEIIYQQAAGFTDREAKKKMELDSIFLLSSVTKPIIITAVLTLIAQGKIKTTDLVTKYLPFFTPKLPNGEIAEITLHHLLTHSSGLSYRFIEAHGVGSYNDLQISDGFDDIFISLEENMHRLAKAPLLFALGQSWCYSLSIDVLGAILQEVTNLSLPNLIHSLITNPLNMDSTGFTVTNPSQLVKHYYSANSIPQLMQDVCKINLPAEWNNGILTYAPNRIFKQDNTPSAGAGMAGSAPDFMRLLLALSSKNSANLPSNLISQMNQLELGIEIQAQGPGWGFGYGGAVLGDPILAQSPQAKGTIQWGGVYDHNWFYDPENDLTVVNFTNTALEGVNGKYPVLIRDAIYGV